jgi:hypothetical protein
MELEVAIKGIADVRSRIHKHDLWDEPVALSDIMVKLATYNSYLADHLAPLHKEATDKSYAVFTEAASEGVPVTKAEAMSRGESTEERHIYENTLNIYRATDNLISVIQSRVRVAENSLKREGLQT